MSRLAFATEAAFRAGRLTLRYFQTGAAVELKSDITPVTAADREAEALIREAIEKRYPGETVLGEEQGLSGASDDRWVVDPIDGTKSFVAGVPLFATLLSYEVAGEPVLGVCYFPALDEMLYAEKGQGAYWNGRAAHVSHRRVVAGSTIACGSLVSLAKRNLLEKVVAFGETAQATRTWTDAYGHALVATGRADLMIDPIVNRWDISSMSLIVREAGGAFTDFQGENELSAEALSGAPELHARCLEAIRS